MKILAFAARQDEITWFNKYSKKFNLDVTLEQKPLSPETVFLAKGYDSVTFIGSCTVDEVVLKKLKSYGIDYIASRSTGYDNIDLNCAKELGIKVSNSSYSPYSVAEFTLMTAMMMLRNIPATLKNIEHKNFSLKNLIGREIRSQKVGVIGTGKIGKIVIKLFQSMGADVVAYDLYESDENIKYVSLEKLLSECDVITLHAPLTSENKYLINEKSISKMKDGVILINTARGELIKLSDLLEGLNNKKVLAAALDTFEGESEIVHKDCSLTGYNHEILKKLLDMKNVLITSHQAFYTEEAVSDMVESALSNLIEFNETGDAQNNLIKI
ncbi:NAD(P)-dependent oxidoreductase [Candidatus Cetobacterium colombiensis]|uniref:NAD(P)-dependent oxidoreductase n=1 Tax=Candidatus Cetobacterium colombiensis TaxID=3073100 RepID=A0ABU4W7C9_9FUSO|nr:NAD(P)-dependent oxidoreductase [Candidatus Cetobacterium colombiensis]MDX8334942.1 NAD(P)-dependent oxidoreductase [Candidatus Cetobacterium colombiensis]